MGQAFQDYNSKDAVTWSKEKSAIWNWIDQHQAFSQAYSRCHNHLLGGDGPLPADYRHYIAIMACTESKCCSLLEEERDLYLGTGGDCTWLEGLQYAPLKLRRLHTLNNILSTRPWTFHQQHIKALLTGAGSWSLAELLQAIVILVHFHSACSYAVAHQSAATTCDTTTATATAEPAKEVVVTCDNNKHDQHHKIRQKAKVEERAETKSSNQRSFKLSLRSGARSHKKVGAVKPVVAAAAADATDNATNQRTAVQAADKKFEEKDGLVERLDQMYEQYELQPIKSPQQPDNEHHLNINDFSWDDHGFSVMSRFYADMSLLLDDKFRVAKQMTYHSYGDHSDVDTTRFRRAVWNSVQMMYGVIHEDFDYTDMEHVLSPAVNQFISVAARCPQNIHSHQNTNNLLLDFTRSEKAHLNILIVEAKLQALLLFSLRAVMNHMART